MSNVPTQTGDTGSGFITGTDPRQAPMTQAELTALQQGSGQVPQVVINNGGQPTVGPQGQRMFTEEEVGAIRTEEKDKLYGRMSTMEDELRQLREEREAREAELAHQSEERESLARQAEEQQMDVRQLLERKDQEWKAEFQRLEGERERDRAIFEQERRYTQLQEYQRNRIEQESEWILPELRDLIDGGNEVEVDNAIEIMKQRTGAILQSVQSAVTSQRAPLRGVAPTGAPPVGPMEQQMSTQQVSVDDIRRMDTKTFGQYRDQLLGIASRAGAAGLRRDQAQ
jgi:hypothetical protein